MSNLDGNKCYTDAIRLNHSGETCFHEKKYTSALEFYTQGLLCCPALHENSHNSSTGIKNEYPLGLVYSNRSAALFRLKKYKECVADLKRAFANSCHDDARFVELMNRLAWSYWHLKEYGKCSGAVNLAVTSCQYKAVGCKELDVLQALLVKSKVKLNDKSSSNAQRCEEKEDIPQLHGGENVNIKGVSSCIKLDRHPVRGRHLVATSVLKPGSNILSEEVFSGVLSEKLSNYRCNYCYQDCRLHGIPCYGCSKALYCDERCRQQAWVAYHWLECSMWPVLQTIDLYAHLALRTLLCAAHEMCNSDEGIAKLKNHCVLISSQMQNSYLQSKASNSKKKGLKKTQKHFSATSKLQGDQSKPYQADYWSVFSLQTHESEQSKIIVTKCALYANYLARVVNRCLQTSCTSKHKKSSNNHVQNQLEPLETELKLSFAKMSLENLFNQAEKSKGFTDIDLFKEKTLDICKTMAPMAPVAKLKQPAGFLSKDLPRSFQDILAYLLKRHMLQLYTNCQAIYDVIPDEPKNDTEVATVTQQRIASAIFPSTSLLNHGCNPNTVVNFTGRRILVRAIHSINKGSEVEHCYGPCISRHSYEDRQKILKEQYFFTCECEACAKFKDGDSDQRAFAQQFTAYKCQACDGPMLILESKDATDQTIQGRCANKACRQVFDLTNACRTYNKFVSLSNSAVQQLQTNEIDAALQIHETCLDGMKKILYHNHHAIASLHDQVAYCFSLKKDYKSALSHINASLKVVSMRFGSASIEAGREMFKLATIYFNCQMFSEAEKTIDKSVSIYKGILPPDNEELKKANTMSVALKTLCLGASNISKP